MAEMKVLLFTVVLLCLKCSTIEGFEDNVTEVTEFTITTELDPSSVIDTDMDTTTSTTEEVDEPAVMVTSRFKADDDVVEKVNAFGFDLLKTMMRRSGNENVVISPTGVAGLLAMTLLGSAGTTYNEIAKLIGFTQDILSNRNHHEDLGTKLQNLNANDTKTLYANAVFVDVHSRLRHVYREYLERVYRGEAREVDFVRSAEVKQIINEWVKSHTGNKIEEFLQQPLPHSTKAVLLSALYFSGQWEHPFIPEYTAKLPFTTPTKEISVDLMANFGQFDYLFSYEDELQIIGLPYNDSVTTMYVMKPRFPKHLNLSQLIENLDYQKIDSLIGKMSKKKCVVRFPKMELNTKANLKESLMAMGATTMFSSGEANFALMLENNNRSAEDELATRVTSAAGDAMTLKDLVDGLANPGVHVDSILHEVKITIDEYGTEAVAATAGIMARTAELFYTDSPFYMFIRNERTKLVTFSAVVFDPSL